MEKQIETVVIKLKEGVTTITYKDGSIEKLNEEEFKKRFPFDEEKAKKDRGFGNCSCGYPLEKYDDEHLLCWLGAYCEHKTGLIKIKK